LLVLRHMGGFKTRPLTSSPAFWMACICWVLGFKALRFWNDWGRPALLVLLTCDLQLLLQARFAADSFKRLALTGGLAVMTVLAATNDSGSRWTWNLTQQYLTPDNPELDGWLPEKDGILYSADMTLFFQTFFKNPKADWRYIVGYEPALMPDADFEVYLQIRQNWGDAKAYQPWANKMRREDRLVMRGGRGSPPNIPQLEWEYGVSGIWIGRTPRIPQSGTPPPTIPAKATPEDSTNAVNSVK
jgi:hypothetical protein